MIGLDTNVLVRFLTEDDPVQTPIAREWIRAALKNEESLYLTSIGLCELVWVLSRSYGIPKAGILEILEELLATENVDIEDYEATRHALHDYSNTNADFADCLIGRKNAARGCKATLTFDRKLARIGMLRG